MGVLVRLFFESLALISFAVSQASFLCFVPWPLKYTPTLLKETDRIRRALGSCAGVILFVAPHLNPYNASSNASLMGFAVACYEKQMLMVCHGSVCVEC